jgi:predicted PurR-regulated permease PerM
MAPRSSISAEAFYAGTFALVALFVLGFLLYQILLPFFSPIAWALFVAFLILPIHLWLTARLGGRAKLSAALLTLATVAILIGPLAGLGAAFGAQAGELLRYLQQFAADRGTTDFADLAQLPVIGTALAWLQDTMGFSLEQIRGWAIEAARNVLGFFASLGRQIFFGALGAVVGFALMVFILFFAILDGEEMATTLRALIPMSPEDKKRLLDHLAAVTRAMVYGTGVTALVQGALVGIAFAVLGLPSPVVFGVLAALCALIPMLGTPIVWVPALLVLAGQQRWGAALFLLLWGIFVVTIDNFLRPWLVAGKAEVHPLTVFIGVLGGVTAFGPIGMIAGPLVLALLIALIRFTVDVREAPAADQTD